MVEFMKRTVLALSLLYVNFAYFLFHMAWFSAMKNIVEKWMHIIKPFHLYNLLLT